MQQEKKQDLMATAGAQANAWVGGSKRLKTTYEVTAFGPDGKLKWTDIFENLVVNDGLDDSLDKHLKGSAYTAAWYVGLTAGTPSGSATDNMQTHSGWSEVTAYTGSNRATLTLGTVSSQSVDNSASKASFSIDTNSTTIGGAFVTTEQSAGVGTGTLYGIGGFTAGDKSLDDGDTLNVTVTFTASAS